jgi:hypothetical protein
MGWGKRRRILLGGGSEESYENMCPEPEPTDSVVLMMLSLTLCDVERR